VNVAGLDIGFSATRRSAGVGVYDGEQIKLIDCFGWMPANRSLGLARMTLWP
jgi:hypothetical protein